MMAPRLHCSDMKTKKHILVAIDFSKLSVQAILLAKQLAKQLGATIHLANVYQSFYPATFIAPISPVIAFPIPDYEQGIEDKLMKRLRELAQKHELIATVCHLCSGGPPYDELCNLAKAISADLIIMPTRGHTGLKHLFLGSTAERVVQHAPCPVFVVREAKQPTKNGADNVPIKNILVPIDFSSCSLDGLNYAIEFARQTGAKIIVQHAVDLGPMYMADSYGVYDLSKYQDFARVNAKQQMREFLKLARFGSIEFEAVVTLGTSVWEICGLAKNRLVDLIITSTHGRTGFKHVLIGSTAEQVVRHAPCSVLVVPSHPKIRSASLSRGKRTNRKSHRSVLKGRSPRSILETEKLTRQYRKRNAHPFPERRSTNRFRESHFAK